MTQNLPIRLDRADGLATLTLCRPEQKNVVTPEFIAALQAHADALHEDRELRVVLLRHDGPCFSVGADVKAMGRHLDDLPAYIDTLIAPLHRALLRLMRLPVPVVGLLQGIAAGGGASIALGCDVLVAARSARLVFAYPQLGATPDAGLSHALIERLGPARALQEFVLSGDIDMLRAERLGLVHEVADDGQAGAAALRVVERLAAVPSGAAKRLFLRGTHDRLERRLADERASFLQCAATAAFRERVLAFSRRDSRPHQ